MRNDRLLRLREDCGMTRADLAEKSGVALTSIGFYERGEREPGADSLEKICKAMSVSADYLLGLSDTRSYTEVTLTNPEGQKTPVQLMADLLGEMTERATKAERQRDEARQSSDDWYQHWQTKDAQLKAANDRIAELEAQLGVKDMKGATNNG